MVSLFESHELFPVFVFDDSDTWLRIAGLDRVDTATAFFMKNVRMMCKEVEVGLVLAVHTDYLQLDGYAKAAELLSGEVPIPRLANAQHGVERILHERLVVAEVHVELRKSSTMAPPRTLPSSTRRGGRSGICCGWSSGLFKTPSPIATIESRVNSSSRLLVRPRDRA